MSLVAAIPAITSAVAVCVGRSFDSRIQPTALKADTDEGPTGQQGNKAQRNQDHSPVHTPSHIRCAACVAQNYGPLVASRTGGLA